MKTAKVTHFIIMGMLAAAIVVAVIAYSVAWFQTDVATPYVFDIHANGVLYVYVDAEILENDSPLVPAVAIPGAISEGLPYNVLTAYNAGDASPSYIQKVASVTSVGGMFGVNNEGYAYDKVELPKDENGYTLYPVITETGKISWKDESNHELGWNQSRRAIQWNVVSAGNDQTFVAAEWNRESDYEPLINSEGYVVWKDGSIPYDHNEIARGEEYWECREVLREGSSECTVNLSVRFKASSDPAVDDYYDPNIFSIRRLYITREDEEIADGVGMGPTYGNTGVPFVTQSTDKTKCSYLMYGSEEFYLHAEVYLSQPDELLDPTLRGKAVYMVVAVTVEVTQFGES